MPLEDAEPMISRPNLRAAEALAAGLFDRLLSETSDPPGVTRVAYGPGEAAAFRLVAEAAVAFGAEQSFDAAGNQFLTVPGQDRSRRIVVGSHLDSVPHGGNFDGAAGVLMGVALQAALVQAGIAPPFDLTVACLRAEESCWFPHSYIGSKTALGRLEDGVLDQVRRSDTGKTLAEHMREQGFDPDAVRDGDRLLEPEHIVAYIEPHIEQAPLLLSRDLPLAAVTGIRGSFRYREMRCHGEYGHSGAMPRGMRRDAGLASARLICALHEYWQQVEARGGDLTVTFGQIGTDPAQHSFSKVPGEVKLCLDVRSQSTDELEAAEAQLGREAERISAKTGTRFELGPRSGSEPALMSERLVEIIGEAANATGIPATAMASGAGHDAAVFAQAGVPSVMMFLRNEHGSHNPDEHMESADFNAGLAVLFEMMRAPAARWRPE